MTYDGHRAEPDIFACLQHLTQLETLDLKRVGRRYDILVRILPMHLCMRASMAYLHHCGTTGS